MNFEERQGLVREVALAGNCSHPIRLSGDMVNLATGEVEASSLRIACKDRRRVVCPACSYLYKADAWILVSTGLVGGKGTPEIVGSHPRLFVTLTAPSFGPVHTSTRTGACVVARPDVASPGHAPASSLTCFHGRARFCARRHAPDDPLLGRPICHECFDYEGAVLWNAHASRLWNNTIQLIRRSLAEAGGMAQTNLKTVAQVHYLKVAEVQRRGLVHLHVIVRADGTGYVGSDPPAWLTAELLSRVVRRAVGEAAARGLHGRTMKWGKIIDVRDLRAEPTDVTKVASYVAMYSTKTADGSTALARRFHSRRQIESLVDDPHARGLSLTAWDLGRRAELAPLHLRDYAHTFGFTGQLITKSRGYSTTFAALRSARTAHMASQRVADPLEGTFHYDGRGYDDPRASDLAEVFFTMQRELREEAAEVRRMRPDDTGDASL